MEHGTLPMPALFAGWGEEARDGNFTTTFSSLFKLMFLTMRQPLISGPSETKENN